MPPLAILSITSEIAERPGPPSGRGTWPVGPGRAPTRGREPRPDPPRRGPPGRPCSRPGRRSLRVGIELRGIRSAEAIRGGSMIPSRAIDPKPPLRPIRRSPAADPLSTSMAPRRPNGDRIVSGFRMVLRASRSIPRDPAVLLASRPPVPGSRHAAWTSPGPARPGSFGRSARRGLANSPRINYYTSNRRTHPSGMCILPQTGRVWYCWRCRRKGPTGRYTDTSGGEGVYSPQAGLPPSSPGTSQVDSPPPGSFAE